MQIFYHRVTLGDGETLGTGCKFIKDEIDTPKIIIGAIIPIKYSKSFLLIFLLPYLKMSKIIKVII